MRFVAQFFSETGLSTSNKGICTGFIAFCSATTRFRLCPCQYLGCSARHSRTRSTFHAPRQNSRFSGFCRHRCKLAARRARLHCGFRQYCWSCRCRQSGTNERLQCRHFSGTSKGIPPVSTNRPLSLQTQRRIKSVREENRPRRKKILLIESPEENRLEVYRLSYRPSLVTFRPPLALVSCVS